MVDLTDLLNNENGRYLERQILQKALIVFFIWKTSGMISYCIPYLHVLVCFRI